MGRDGHTRRRITLQVGQSLESAGIKITILRDNADGSVLLDVSGPPAKILPRTAGRTRQPLRRQRDGATTR